MTKNYLADLDIASLLAALDPPKNYLADVSTIANALAPPPPPRNALLDAFRSLELSEIGRAAPPPSGLFGLAQALNPRGIAGALRTPWDVPAPAVPTSLVVKWVHPPGEWWYLDNAAKVSPVSGGVYIVWRDGDGRCVKVGQGNIPDRLGAHSRDRAIMAAAGGAALRATWCPVHAHLRDGVERFLGEHYGPLVAERFPAARAIRVNLPG
jgi:hypothetical protein